MSKVQHRTWANSQSVKRAKNRIANKNISKEDYSLIKKANHYIKLIDVLKSYKIKIGPVVNSDGWSKKIKCPFPLHNDKTASFCYNHKTDAFYCFGCSLGGRAVEFLAQMESKKQRETALYLLDNINIDPYAAEIDFIDNNIEIEKELLNFALFLSDKIQHNKTNKVFIEYVEKLLWSFDDFLSNISRHGIDTDILVEKLKSKKDIINNIN